MDELIPDGEAEEHLQIVEGQEGELGRIRQNYNKNILQPEGIHP